MKISRTYVSAVLLAAGIFSAPLEASGNPADADTLSVRFPVSKWTLDPDFADNASQLDILGRRISDLRKNDSTVMVKNITVIGGASPEGSIDFNRLLSRHRADAIYDWVSSRFEVKDTAVVFNYLGRDWNGLRKLAEDDGNIPYKSDVLNFLDEVISAGQTGASLPFEPLARIRKMHGGVPYNYMYRNLFPTLRASSVIIGYTSGRGHIVIPSLPAPEIPVSITVPDIVTLYIPQPSEKQRKECRPFYMGLKTNMLYDALLLPNLGAEFYVGKRWSVGGDWLYGWWDRDASHHYWRAYGGNLYVRRWFGHRAEAKPLTGHHIGLYAGVITYDFELGGAGIMGGLPGGTLWDRCNYMAGIEYGYSLPVAHRINIDFTIGVGYLGGKYEKYEPKNGYYQWKSTNRLNWFGPTKAEISLVWLIGCDNYNRGKGGVQ